MLPNKHIKKLRPYKAVPHKAWDIGNTDGVLKLDWNEATVLPSPKVRKDLESFLSSGRLNWYPNIRNKTLIGKIADYSQVSAKHVQYFAGSDDLHEYIIGAFTEPGDGAIIVSPTYDNFRASAESKGVRVNYHNLTKSFNFQPTRLISQIKEAKSKLVYICNPNNPTGTIVETDEIENLISHCPDTLFVIDEAYYEFAKKSVAGMAVKNENVIVSRTFSKAFALAGFRIGYAITSAENIEHIDKIRNPKNVTTLSQIAAIAALDDVPYMEAYVGEVLLAKKLVCKTLSKAGYKITSEGGNFILLKMGSATKRKFIDRLLNRNIFVRDYGHVQGMEEYIRVTIGTREQMKPFVEEALDFSHD
ncbi:MAG: histidinol-phosphate transaminase [Candidatus Dadabacteria bacterium]|nr:histidinol-phosphate transaminase [Candidatus Dadabacteria bacterium]